MSLILIGEHECYFHILQELNNYLAVSTTTSIIVDRSSDGDFLRMDFNIRYIINQFCFSAHMCYSLEVEECRNVYPSVCLSTYLVSSEMNVLCGLNKVLRNANLFDC